jgi:hypothetical protein
MNLSIIAIGVTVISILIFGWFSYKYECKPEPPDISRFPFNQSTGKERSFVNKTGDSSMWTESSRRIAIAKAYRPGWCAPGKTIRETKHTTGTTSGVVEAFFLSAFGRICPACSDIIYDGNAHDGCIMDGNTNDGCVIDGNKNDNCEEFVYDGNINDYCEELVYDGNN